MKCVSRLRFLLPASLCFLPFRAFRSRLPLLSLRSPFAPLCFFPPVRLFPSVPLSLPFQPFVPASLLRFRSGLLRSSASFSLPSSAFASAFRSRFPLLSLRSPFAPRPFRLLLFRFFPSARLSPCFRPFASRSPPPLSLRFPAFAPLRFFLPASLSRCSPASAAPLSSSSPSALLSLRFRFSLVRRFSLSSSFRFPFRLFASLSPRFRSVPACSAFSLPSLSGLSLPGSLRFRFVPRSLRSHFRLHFPLCFRFASRSAFRFPAVFLILFQFSVARSLKTIQFKEDDNLFDQWLCTGFLGSSPFTVSRLPTQL